MSERLTSGELPQQSTGYIFNERRPDKQTEVPITDENSHLFLFNKDRQRLELVYQGSQTIIDLLSLFHESKTFDRNTFRRTYPRERHLAFFDVYGTFHNFVLLEDLKLDQPREGEPKSDVAFFWEADSSTDGYNPLAISIPEIYCLSQAQHPIIWGGDGNN